MKAKIRASCRIAASAVAVLLLSWGSGMAQGKRADPLHVAYTSTTATRAPLWIAKEAGVFEKYGVDVRLIYIRAGQPSVSALLSGDVQVSSDPAAAAATAGARGAPIVVIGTYGLAAYRLVAHPSITTVQQLKGKTVGSMRPGSGPDALLHRLLPRLGLIPGKDVNLLPTGIAESNKRMLAMLQGNYDATLAVPDNVYQMELKGQKVSVLADPQELGIVTSVSDITTTRQVLKEKRSQVKAFLKAFIEGTWMGRNDKDLAFRVFKKYLQMEDPKLLESMHKNYLLGSIPLKPYPLDGALQADIEYLGNTIVPELKGKKAADFIDATILKEIEDEGFFARLQK